MLYAYVLPVFSGIMLGLQKLKETAVVSSWSTVVRQMLIILFILLLRNFVGLVIAWVVGGVVSGLLYD